MLKSSVIGQKDHGPERQQLLNSLLDAVKMCQTKFGTKNSLATENNESVANLCLALELCLSHGLRSKPVCKSQSALDHVSELWNQTFKQTEQLCFWHFVQLFLTRHELERYHNLSHVSTDIGRGRAWLRSALNERSLERYFNLLLAKSGDARVYYHNWALLLDQDLNSTLPNMAAGLGAILFALPIDEDRYNESPPKSVEEAAIKTEPVLTVPIEEPEVPRRRKRNPANVVSFEDSDTGSVDALEVTETPGPSIPSHSRNSLHLYPTEKPAIPVLGSSPSPSSNDSSLHEFESSSSAVSKSEMVPTLTPMNDDDNVGELMLISIEGLPGDDISLGPDTDDCLDVILNRSRLDVDQVTSHDLDQLHLTLETLHEANNTLRNKLRNLLARHKTEVTSHETKLLTLTRENEVLKHQLRKYVSAVQMLNKDGAAHEALAYLEASQMAAQQREEAAKYQEQLVEVAQMHGELMEFNEKLARSVSMRDEVIKRLERELTDLRGPLPPSCSSDDTFSPPDALVHIWIPSAFLSGGSSAVHHLYQVYVRMRDTEWNVYRRYAQFYSLHKQLKQSFPVVATLDFPPKKTIGNKDAKFVEERRQRLQRYLRQAVDAVSRARPELADPDSLITIIPFFSQTPSAKEPKPKTKSLLKRRNVEATPPAAQYNGL